VLFFPGRVLLRVIFFKYSSQDYRLDFNGYAQRWGGAVATIVPDLGREVWGALWEMNVSDVENIDR
jgi:hypothetical protein